MKSPTVPETARRDARPPVPTVAAPPSGAAGSTLRPTVHQRPLVRPRPWRDRLAAIGYELGDPYVRRYWTAVIGPGAVADLMRLAAAARVGGAIRRPVHIAVLAREGLVRSVGDRVVVRTRVPPLPGPLARRLPPALRSRHARERG